MALRHAASGLALALALTLAPAAHARDTALHLPVKDVLEDPEFKARLGSDVALYFGNQAPPAIAQSLAEVTTNKKTNAFGKSDEKACRWVMLSALLQLVDAARQRGGDAVVEIRSDYKRVEWVSDTEYECHAGGVVAGVALKAKVVKLKK
jgi:uncharacterized protein YbjQ (UPF0145 family)